LSQLGLTLDGESLYVPRIEMAVFSSVSLAPTGQLVAVADMGQSLAIITANGRQRHRVRALPVFSKEVTRIDDLHWSPDAKWLLFTERHFQRRAAASGVIGHGNSVVESLSLVRAINVASGEALTLVRGENASWR
jgi:hypothetical protein